MGGGTVSRCVYLQIHYDGWSQQFDVWCDADNSDLHPVGWCQRTGHPLEPPPGGWRCGRETGGETAPHSAALCVRQVPPRCPPPLRVCVPPQAAEESATSKEPGTPDTTGEAHLGRFGWGWRLWVVLLGGPRSSRLSRLSCSAFGCPYSDINMRKEVVLPDRLGGERVITLVPVTVCSHGNQPDR